MTFWMRIQAHDAGSVQEPASLREAVSTLATIASRDYTDGAVEMVFPPGSARASRSSTGSLQLWIPFECGNELLVPDMERFLGSLLSPSFDPGDCWARRRFIDKSTRTEMFNALKTVAPPINADYFLDYVRPLEKIAERRMKSIVIPFGARLLDNARQALVPDAETREPEESGDSDVISLEKIAWRGLVLKPRIKTRHWDFRIQKDEEDSTFFVEDKEELGRFARSTSRNELRELVRENLCFLWQTYAIEDDDRLTPGAQDLKQYLLSRFEEV